MLSSLRNERDHNTLMAMIKKRVDLQDPIVIDYSSILTPYALGFVSTISPQKEDKCYSGL